MEKWHSRETVTQQHQVLPESKPVGVCGKLCVGHQGGTCKGQLPERSVEASSTEDTPTSVGLSQGLAAVGWSDLQVEGQAGRGAEDSQDKVAPGQEQCLRG